jgi:hypothetical protein
MELQTNRTIDPDSLRASLTFMAEDIDLAFTNQTDPDEQLFYDFFSPTLKSRPVSEQLLIFQKVAALAEAAAQAKNVVFSGGTVENK